MKGSARLWGRCPVNCPTCGLPLPPSARIWLNSGWWTGPIGLVMADRGRTEAGFGTNGSISHFGFARGWRQSHVGRQMMGMAAIRRKGVTITLVALVLMLTTAAGAATDVGTPDNPVRLSVVASDADPAELVESLADALHDATGLEFEFEYPEFGTEAIEWMCADYPDSSVRIMGSDEYVFADQECGVTARLHVFRFGSDSYFGGFFVPEASDLYALDDLDGLEWYHPDTSSISGYMVPKGMLEMAGVEYLEPDWEGNHFTVVQAVYENALSDDPPIFGTAFLDARTMLLEEYPDALEKVRVLAQSPAIPNSPVAFGPDFPADLRRQIEKAMVKLADPEGPDYAIWEEALWEDSSLDKLQKREFDFLRSALEAAGIVIGDL